MTLPRMRDSFDWFGIMTYDYYGSWTPQAGPNAALYGTYPPNSQGWVDFSVDYYAGTRGLPKSKLLIGIPFYGWQFNAAGMWANSTSASQLRYALIAPRLDQGWTRTWDAGSLTPYMVNGSQTQVISYDDSQSVGAKCDYIKEKGVAGTIIWALGQDLINGHQPLLDVVAKTLGVMSSVSIGSENSPPAALALEQNYPNPFNSQTTISYHLTEPGSVSLTLYDVLGREVRRIVSGDQMEGTHTATIHADDLATGVYVYRLVWRGKLLARTLVILR
jgi:GH18 family chitinase